jgi:hypothetical protein
MKLTRRTCTRPAADAAAMAAMSRLARAQFGAETSLSEIGLGALSCLRAEALGRPLTRQAREGATGGAVNQIARGLRASSGIWI